jgi:hypothetical protein
MPSTIFSIRRTFGKLLCIENMDKRKPIGRTAAELGPICKHDQLSYASILAFREVASMIPEHVPIILETPVFQNQIETEIQRALEALPVCKEELVGR